MGARHDRRPLLPPAYRAGNSVEIGTGLCDLVGQRPVLVRVDPVHAAPEHGDRASARRQRRPVRLGVDATRKP